MMLAQLENFHFQSTFRGEKQRIALKNHMLIRYRKLFFFFVILVDIVVVKM